MMINSSALLLFLWPHVLNDSRGSAITLPFTHDFNTGIYGWQFDYRYWDWTGSPTRTADINDFSSFTFNGSYVWTQTSLPQKFDSSMSFKMQQVRSVTKSTKFTFRYWFQTLNPTDNTGVYFYIIDLSVRHGFPPAAKIKESSSHWRDVTIDCQGTTCCEISSTCDVQIQIISSVGNSDGDGLTSILCVTTEDGCGPLPPGNSALTSTPNRLAITSIIVISHIVQPLFR